MIHVFDVFFHVEYDGAIGFMIGVNALRAASKRFKPIFVENECTLKNIKNRQKNSSWADFKTLLGNPAVVRS